MRELPRITEVKRTLTGVEKRFSCAVLAQAATPGGGTHVIVLHVTAVAMHVHGVDLAPGTVTFGHFWTDRPYNVYHWLSPDSGQTIGYYFNLADETAVGAGLLTWRDLAVDVLMSPDGRARVLDEDEIPADASVALRDQIARATAAVVSEPHARLAELEEHRRRLWPTVPRAALRPLDVAESRGGEHAAEPGAEAAAPAGTPPRGRA